MVDSTATPTNGNPSTIDRRVANDEQELAQLQEETTRQEVYNAEPVLEPSNPSDIDALAAKEKTWEKRYADLRRWKQKTDDENAKRFQAMEAELKTLRQANSKVELPKTEEELTDFLTNYPDLAAIVDTMILKRINTTSENIETQLEQIKHDKLLAEREKAVANLMKAHPDFEDLIHNEEFHEWAKTQPASVRRDLYENVTDWEAASRVIDLYKYDKAKVASNSKTRTLENTRSAAEAVTRTNNTQVNQPNPDGGKKTWKESEVEKLKPDDFIKFEADIMLAIRENRFEYDKSGAAR